MAKAPDFLSVEEMDSLESAAPAPSGIPDFLPPDAFDAEPNPPVPALRDQQSALPALNEGDPLRLGIQSPPPAAEPPSREMLQANAELAKQEFFRAYSKMDNPPQEVVNLARLLEYAPSKVIPEDGDPVAPFDSPEARQSAAHYNEQIAQDRQARQDAESNKSWIYNLLVGVPTGSNQAVASLVRVFSPDLARSIIQRTDEVYGHPDPESWAGTIGSAAGGVLPLLASGLAGGGAKLAAGIGGLMGLGGAEESIARARSKGLPLSAAQETAATLLGGGIGAATGAVQGKLMGGNKAVGAIADKLSGILPPVAARAAAALAVDAGGNALLNPASQVLTNAEEKAIYDRERSLTEGLGLRSSVRDLVQGTLFAIPTFYHASAAAVVKRHQDTYARGTGVNPLGVGVLSESPALKTVVVYSPESSQTVREKKTGTSYLNIATLTDALHQTPYVVSDGPLGNPLRKHYQSSAEAQRLGGELYALRAEASGDRTLADEARAHPERFAKESEAMWMDSLHDRFVLNEIARNNPDLMGEIGSFFTDSIEAFAKRAGAKPSPEPGPRKTAEPYTVHTRPAASPAPEPMMDPMRAPEPSGPAAAGASVQPGTSDGLFKDSGPGKSAGASPAQPTPAMSAAETPAQRPTPPTPAPTDLKPLEVSGNSGQLPARRIVLSQDLAGGKRPAGTEATVLTRSEDGTAFVQFDDGRKMMVKRGQWKEIGNEPGDSRPADQGGIVAGGPNESGPRPAVAAGLEPVVEPQGVPAGDQSGNVDVKDKVTNPAPAAPSIRQIEDQLQAILEKQKEQPDLAKQKSPPAVLMEQVNLINYPAFESPASVMEGTGLEAALEAMAGGKRLREEIAAGKKKLVLTQTGRFLAVSPNEVNPIAPAPSAPPTVKENLTVGAKRADAPATNTPVWRPGKGYDLDALAPLKADGVTNAVLTQSGLSLAKDGEVVTVQGKTSRWELIRGTDESNRPIFTSFKREGSQGNGPRQAEQGFSEAEIASAGTEEGKDFNLRLHEWMIGGRQGQQHLLVGTPSAKLRQAGIVDHPIMLGTSLLNRKQGRDADHAWSARDLLNLTDRINNPIFVLSYSDPSGQSGHNIITEANVNGKNLLVGVQVKQAGRGFEVNSIRTLFGKDNDWIASQIESGKLLWIDEQKAREWASHAGKTPKLGAISGPSADTIGTLSEKVNPKPGAEENRSPSAENTSPAAVDPGILKTESSNGTTDTPAAPAGISQRNDPNPEVASGTEGPGRLQGVPGRSGTLRIADGQSEPVQYRAVEAQSLIPSHDARQNFALNPLGDANERPYHDPQQGAESRRLVERIAAQPDVNLLYTDTPSPIDGPPLVGPDGVVLGGNGRTMGVQLAYSRQGSSAQTLRQGAIEAAGKFGMDPAEVARLREPVLVRVMDDPGARGEKSRILNESLSAGKSLATEAVSRAGKLSETTARLVSSQLEEGETLRKALDSGAFATQIIQRFIQDGVWSERDFGQFVNPRTQQLTPEGKANIERVLVGRIISDPSVLGQTSEAIQGKLLGAMPDLMGLEGSSADVLPLIRRAIPALNEFRASGETLGDHFFDQQKLTPAAGFGDPAVAMMVHAMDTLGPRQFKSTVARYRELTQPPTTIFGTADKTEPQEALWQSFGRGLEGTSVQRAVQGKAQPTQPVNPLIEAANALKEAANALKEATAAKTATAAASTADTASQSPPSPPPSEAVNSQEKQEKATEADSPAAKSPPPSTPATTTPVRSRADFLRGLIDQFGFAPDYAEKMIAPLDGFATFWAEKLNRPIGDYWEEAWDSIRSGQTPGEGTVYQPAATAGAEVDQVEEARKAWAEQGTESPWFKKWFGDSQVVDENGNPLVVYHGGQPFDQFTGKAFWASDSLDTAQTYADQYSSHNQVIKPLYLRIANPLDLRIEANFKKWAGEPREFHDDQLRLKVKGNDLPVNDIKAAGYDGIIHYDTDQMNRTGGTSYVWFDPAAVKLAPSKDSQWYSTPIVTAGNRGTFDPANPNILYQGGQSDPFYSVLRQGIEAKMPPRMVASAIPNQILRKIPGLKAEELQWSGLSQWLAEQKAKPVTQQEILDYLDANAVRVKELVKGEEEYQDLPSRVGRPSMEIEEAFDSALRRNDRLGFDSLGEARGAIFGHSDWSERWDVASPDDVAAIRRWREAYQAFESSRSLWGDRQTKFQQYTLPGGKAYRELLIQLPSRSDRDYQSPHWDQPNVLVHVRFSERVDAEGNRVLHIEEIQSDWHQQGRETGYQKPLNQARLNEITARKDQIRQELQDIEDKRRSLITTKHQDIDEYHRSEGSFIELGRQKAELSKEERSLTAEVQRITEESRVGLPDAPFKETTDWTRLGLKRMIRWAAENGFDRLTWTTGEQQAERYDLSHQVKEVRVFTREEGTFDLSAVSKEDGRLHDLATRIPPSKLAEYVGKDLAEKIVRGEGTPDPASGKWRIFSGLDLKVGGEGMKGYYGSIKGDAVKPGLLAKVADAYLKSWGVQTETTPIPLKADQTAPVFSIAITPEMKRSALTAGQPLFQGERAAIQFANDSRAILYALQNPDPSSLIHEFTHHFVEQLRKIAAETNDAEAQALLKTAEDYAGVEGGQWTLQNHEKMAQAGEQWAENGQSANPKMAGFFAAFKQWLGKVYAALTRSRLQIEIPPALHDWFERLTGYKAPERQIALALPEARVAERVEKMLDLPKLLPGVLQQIANEAWGGTQAEGKYQGKDLSDAVELGVNRYILHHPEISAAVPLEEAIQVAGQLERLTNKLPTQTKRTQETEQFQQFSTPPHYAYAAAWVANIGPRDILLEPSGGTGSLAVYGLKHARGTVANELSERRANLLRALGVREVWQEDAEQIAKIMAGQVHPTLVVMNPPFSQTAGRLGNKKSLLTGAKHIEEALSLLPEGGRLVAIVGRGMSLEAPTYADWWRNIRARYNLRANVAVEGEVYRKYGTSFGTRLLVLDKNGPTTGNPVAGEVGTIVDLLKTLKGVRDERTPAVEQRTDQPGLPGQAPGSGGVARPGPALSGPASDAVDRGGRVQHGLGVGDGNDGAAPASESPNGDELLPGYPGPEGSSRIDAAAQRDGRRPGDDAAGGSVPSPVDLPRFQPTVAGTVAGGNAEPSAPAGAMTDSIYEKYRPQRAVIPGAQPHPTALVESAAMASVLPPPATYQPRIPAPLIRQGKLSDVQLEALIYAGQSHQEMLPETTGPKGEKVIYRRGFFVGDGTGVGKGAISAGIILDNWNQGRKKAIWISKTPKLAQDALRDWTWLGQDGKKLAKLSQFKPKSDIPLPEGVLFTTYATLADKFAETSDRIEQLAKWFGKDFDGVIIFDEAHQMGNAISVKGKRGMTTPANTALAALALQRRLPNARVVYLSATGATEVSNLAYAERLGLWGGKTAFSDVRDFVTKVASGGVAAMELVARDMKQMGMYLARQLDFAGCEQQKLTHALSEDQRAIYDRLADAWQVVLKNINQALALTGAINAAGQVKIDSRARSSALSAFWNGNLRFFNQVITSMQMPSVLSDIEQELAAGHAAVLQLVNTNEASMARELAKVTDEEDLEQLDLTPRDQLIQLVRSAFPVSQSETYLDENGNERIRPVKDSKGNAVLNPQAVALREQLIADLHDIRVPEGPLEMLLNHFGPDAVAEVTGRTQRVVRLRRNGKEKTEIQKWSPVKSLADAAAFQAGKKNILVFSDAGGTGASYHADAKSSNQKRRAHYLIQAGWRADNAVQGFGRTHRSGEVSQPIYKLVQTDLNGQKRFISTIARRLDQLGALTRGQRQAGSQGMFSELDNLESPHAAEALRQFFTDLSNNKIEGLSLAEFEQQTGLSLMKKDQSGQPKLDPPPMTQFLNRLLSMNIARQNFVFDQFMNRFERALDAARATGKLDVGVETLRADSITKQSESVVYTDPRSGAQTKHVELLIKNRTDPMPFETIARRPGVFFARNKASGRAYAFQNGPNRTQADGSIRETYRRFGPVQHDVLTRQEVDQADKWERIGNNVEAQSAWDDEMARIPAFRQERLDLITGAVLPIWDRIKGDPQVRRLQTDDGERLLGRLIPAESLAATLKTLGLERTAPKLSAPQAVDLILNENRRLRLDNGWVLERRRVAGEDRIELIGPSFPDHNRLREMELLLERHGYQTRLFVPVGANAETVMGRLLERYPVHEVVGRESGPAETTGGVDGDGPMGMAPSPQSPKTSQSKTKPTGQSIPLGDKPISRQEIVDFVVQKLGVMVGNGRFRQRFMGVYFSKPAGRRIRTKVAHDINVLAHEVGHYLHHLLFGFKVDPAHGAELLPLGQKTSLPSYNQSKVLKEGVAEFTRLWLTDPAAAATAAPLYQSAFETRLQELPELWQQMHQLRAMYAQYHAQDEVAKVESLIDFDGDGQDKPRRSPNEQTIRQKLYTELFDELVPLNWMRKGLSGPDPKNPADPKVPAGEWPMAFAQDAYVAARLNKGNSPMVWGWVNFGVRDRSGSLLAPSLVSILDAARVGQGRRYKDFSTYLLARRAKELYQQQKAGQRELRKDLAPEQGALGFTEAQADAVLKAYGSPEFRQAAQDLYAWNKAVLDYIGTAGGYTAGEIAAIQKMNQNYVPMSRIMDEGAAEGIPSGDSMANRTRWFQRIMGSGRRVKPPVSTLIRNTLRLVEMAEANRAAVLALDEIAKSERGGVYADPIPRPMAITQGNLEEIKKALLNAGLSEADLEGLDLSSAWSVFRPTRHNPAALEVAVRKNGQVKVWQIHDPAFYEAITGGNPVVASVVTKFLLLPAKRLFRAGVTIAPEFILGNAMRDQFTASIQSRYNYNPLDFFNGLLQVATKGELYQQWINAKGGGSTKLDLINLKDRKFENFVRDVGRARWDRFLRTTVNPLRWLDVLEGLSQSLEEATRVGEFVKALKAEQANGQSMQEAMTRAALSSRDVTVDFSRGGRISHSINQYAAFFNAGLQGWDYMARNFKNHPVRSGIRAALSLALPAFLLALLCKDNPWWQEKEKERQLYFLIPIGDPRTTETFLRVLKPWEMGQVFGALGETMAGDSTLIREMGLDKDTLANTILGMLPTAIVPLLETIPEMGYDYFHKRTIDRPEERDLEPALRFDRYTSETAKLIGKGMNVSPRKIDHLIYGYTAWLGSGIASNVFDPAITAATGNEKAPLPHKELAEWLPGLKRFYSGPLSASRSQSLVDLYEQMDQLRTVERSAKALPESERGGYLQKHQTLLDQAPRLDAAADLVKGLREEINNVYSLPLAPPAKRMRLLALNHRMIEVARGVEGKLALPDRPELDAELEQVDNFYVKHADRYLAFRTALNEARQTGEAFRQSEAGQKGAFVQENGAKLARWKQLEKAWSEVEKIRKMQMKDAGNPARVAMLDRQIELIFRKATAP